MELIKPNRLRKGDTIRIVAPASSMASLAKPAAETGVKNLEKLGFNVEIDPNVYRTYKGTAGKPVERAESLMDAFLDNSVDGIMCCWGGFNSNDIIDYLDYRAIRENPKVFVGYSDITILNTVLYKEAGLVNFQGPAFITFTHKFLMSWEVDLFKQVTMTESEEIEIRASPTFIDDPFYWKHPEEPIKERQNPGWGIVNEGEAEGRLIGGHLGTLLCLAGTKYWPDLKGNILFIECDEEDVGAVNITRQLRHLKHLGVFDEISGLVVGRIPEILGLKGDQSIESIVGDVVDGLGIPVITQFDFGHTNPIATIPIGVRGKLSAEKKSLTLIEARVR
ncbi:LD-carboxypeptidase [Candidatus Bathyarchaeota archaeon]|jgi:muramoyltetrapeptide carboxypeptidase|nr:LD-carboxypeptidase [Candidatus Bathyarchaeota archaeon]MBT4320507.1 LD-carboxypeptidase [Candidatus Bathyarchaeota archaeon]MBT4424905.1 LD-carboxypeptidase [Candidatus Bathyarchaeota archaeon]MBT6605335.1 LD-carboxypeptidase [Candidatus Bathyarchaeota archaeon]MBT7187693.1 LD-carboxypeptidase [Candidatus Bathyarchaeota archaeon]